jgi:hypothetical protein
MLVECSLPVHTILMLEDAKLMIEAQKKEQTMSNETTVNQMFRDKKQLEKAVSDLISHFVDKYQVDVDRIDFEHIMNIGKNYNYYKVCIHMVI